MEFYDAVANRRTVREWSKEDIPEQTLKRILEAGLRAPSNDHLRNWEFIILHTREEKENALRFVRACAGKQAESYEALPHGRPDQRMYAYAMPRQYTMLLDAPYLVIPAFKAGGSIFRANSVNQLNSFASIWCVIENIFLAASAEGLACSMRIPVGAEGKNLSEVLEVPPEYLIPCYIGIGRQADGCPELEQNIYSANQKMHFGKW